MVLRLRAVSAREKIVEAGKARVVPVKLLVGALQIAELAEEPIFRLGRKSHMNAGRAGEPQNSIRPLRERAARSPRRDPVAHQKPGPVAGVNGTATCSFG